MEKISITLSVNEWNVVMAAIGDRPFVQVAALIQEIKSQADAAIAAQQPAPAVNSSEE